MNAIDHLLIPLDGSARAESILPVVQELVPRLPAKVRLFRVIPRLAILAEEDEALKYLNPTEVAAPEVGHGLVDARARLESLGLPTSIEIQAGLKPEGLLATIERQDAALVVMAARGWSDIGRARLSSAADLIVRKAPCPVLLVGPSVSHS